MFYSIGKQCLGDEGATVVVEGETSGAVRVLVIATQGI